jgi:hypothetical protein
MAESPFLGIVVAHPVEMSLASAGEGAMCGR